MNVSQRHLFCWTRSVRDQEPKKGGRTDGDTPMGFGGGAGEKSIFRESAKPEDNATS